MQCEGVLSLFSLPGAVPALVPPAPWLKVCHHSLGTRGCLQTPGGDIPWVPLAATSPFLQGGICRPPLALTEASSRKPLLFSLMGCHSPDRQVHPGTCTHTHTFLYAGPQITAQALGNSLVPPDPVSPQNPIAKVPLVPVAQHV